MAVGRWKVEDDGRDEVEGSHEDARVMMMGATRNDVGDEAGTAGDRHRRTQTPTPLRYWMQIIVDKSIGVNVAHSILLQKRYYRERRSLPYSPRKRYSDKRRYCLHPYPLGAPRKEVDCGYRIFC